eukprot:2917999-Pyramimonas_sp.AAC.1
MTSRDEGSFEGAAAGALERGTPVGRALPCASFLEGLYEHAGEPGDQYAVTVLFVVNRCLCQRGSEGRGICGPDSSTTVGLYQEPGCPSGAGKGDGRAQCLLCSAEEGCEVVNVSGVVFACDGSNR